MYLLHRKRKRQLLCLAQLTEPHCHLSKVLTLKSKLSEFSLIKKTHSQYCSLKTTRAYFFFNKYSHKLRLSHSLSRGHPTAAAAAAAPLVCQHKAQLSRKSDPCLKSEPLNEDEKRSRLKKSAN